MRQDHRYVSDPSTRSLMWLSASRTTQSFRYGTEKDSVRGSLSWPGRYRVTSSVMVSSVIAPPLVLPFLGGPPGDGDRQVVDARTVGGPVGERVLEKARVVALGEVRAGVGPARLLPQQRRAGHSLRHVQHGVEFQRRQE